MIGGIKDAIVEILTENAECAAWATGGIHVRRAPPMPQANPVRLRDRYIVVERANDSPHPTQEHLPSRLTTATMHVSVWASGSRDADEGENLVRRALDGQAGTAAGITVQRIFWRNSEDREVEDASQAEQLIDGVLMEFEVSYTLPTVGQ